ncbi:hypothetical protein [Ensifer sp.]|uniref:hypothetical protein n=1 Tax=Ensifer sp. TaxID=1872086 RepID=UPI00289DB11C|nr:hypothetical protein [Ensifer sp.]
MAMANPLPDAAYRLSIGRHFVQTPTRRRTSFLRVKVELIFERQIKPVEDYDGAGKNGH